MLVGLLMAVVGAAAAAHRWIYGAIVHLFSVTSSKRQQHKKMGKTFSFPIWEQARESTSCTTEDHSFYSSFIYSGLAWPGFHSPWLSIQSFGSSEGGGGGGENKLANNNANPTIVLYSARGPWFES